MWTGQPSAEYILVLGVQERDCVSAMHISVCGEQSGSTVLFFLSPCDCLKVIIFPSCHLRWFSAKANISPSQTTAQSVSALCYETNTSRFFFFFFCSSGIIFLCYLDRGIENHFIWCNQSDVSLKSKISTVIYILTSLTCQTWPWGLLKAILQVKCMFPCFKCTIIYIVPLPFTEFHITKKESNFCSSLCIWKRVVHWHAKKSCDLTKDTKIQ